MADIQFNTVRYYIIHRQNRFEDRFRSTSVFSRTVSYTHLDVYKRQDLDKILLKSMLREERCNKR